MAKTILFSTDEMRQSWRYTTYRVSPVNADQASHEALGAGPMREAEGFMGLGNENGLIGKISCC